MKPIWKIFSVYMLTILLMLICQSTSGQIVVTHFNAEWNDPNKAEWVGELEECEITYVDIAASPKIQKKHKVIVLPTIIIFKDGEEVKRWQADLSFKMIVTREELQDYIDELLMEDF
ncbi:thioredoxin family protein [Candidatus Poseidoniaceae archaeon]|nr:thioredoxin family protein [Candidatus Poseidoniaceae archaeon]